MHAGKNTYLYHHKCERVMQKDEIHHKEKSGAGKYSQRRKNDIIYLNENAEWGQ